MTFKPAVWFPIAVLLSAANVVAVWFAALPAEPLHATIHAGLAVAFGVWARRLRQPAGGNELGAGFDALELEISELRHQLSDAQERLDFAERMLAEPEPRRADPDRRDPKF
jgi:hypothetical protein